MPELRSIRAAGSGPAPASSGQAREPKRRENKGTTKKLGADAKGRKESESDFVIPD